MPIFMIPSQRRWRVDYAEDAGSELTIKCVNEGTLDAPGLRDIQPCSKLSDHVPAGEADKVTGL